MLIRTDFSCFYAVWNCTNETWRPLCFFNSGAISTQVLANPTQNLSESLETVQRKKNSMYEMRATNTLQTEVAGTRLGTVSGDLEIKGEGGG